MSRRKRILAVAALLVVALAGFVVWQNWPSRHDFTDFPDRPDEPITPSQSPGKVVPAADYQLVGPFTHDNLAVYLVVAPETLTGASFVTLGEALEQKTAVVHETGTVSRLAVENLSGDELFISAGDIVKGGKQDRTLPYDAVIGANSGQVSVDSFCVEQGRWKERGKESKESFSKSEYSLGSSDMKKAAYAPGASQGEVWKNVSKTQSKLAQKTGVSVKAEASATSLQLTLEAPAVREKLAPYLAAVQGAAGRHPAAVGCVVVVGGRVVSADVYATRGLFGKLWPKLAEGAAVEAFLADESPAGGVASEADVRAFLAAAEGGTPVREAVTARTYVLVKQSDKTVLMEACDRSRDNLVLHRGVLAR